jgi:hypothetical protein
MIAVRSPVSPGAESLWAITTFFNPMRYQRRLLNYRLFRERLNLPLVAIELAYGADFELTENDADILVQLRGKDVMWQKKRLLNVALQHLPSACRKFVWVDCDVIFETDDWPERVSRLLDRFPIVQPFSHLQHMPRNWRPCEGGTLPEFTQQSVTFMIASGMPASASMAGVDETRLRSNAPGVCWAARRELLEQHGFYDTSVVGGDDRAMATAAYGCFEEAIHRLCMNNWQGKRYLAWAKPFYETVRGEVGVLEGNLFHLWHGEMINRRSVSRYEGLQPFDFNPFEDIAIDDNGSWRWNTNKPEMHEYVRDYFASRKEDG